MAGLASIIKEVRRLGRGPLFYLINNGAPISMIRRHRIFFEKLCGLEMIGLDQARERYMRRDEDGHLISCPPEYQRLYEIVQSHFKGLEPIKTKGLLPDNALAKKSVDRYLEQNVGRQNGGGFWPGKQNAM